MTADTLLTPGKNPHCHSVQIQPTTDSVSEELQANALTLQAEAQTHPQGTSQTVTCPDDQKRRDDSSKVYEW